MVFNSGYWPDRPIKLRCYWSSVSEAVILLTMKTLNAIGVLWPVFCHRLKSLKTFQNSFKIFFSFSSVVQSFYRRQFCLSPSLSRLCGAGNYWLRFSGVCSKVSKPAFLSKSLTDECWIRKAWSQYWALRLSSHTSSVLGFSRFNWYNIGYKIV